ncbi:MAG: sigma-54 factor interaction domain-containing protein [Acidobacteriota bacterium]
MHRRSAQRAPPFIKVNCAAIPEGLLESELFGHVKGAFTGATGMRKGKCSLADRGSICLDEIGTMGASLQAKLLRVLKEREIEPLGGERTERVDVRVIAATNRDLRQLVAHPTPLGATGAQVREIPRNASPSTGYRASSDLTRSSSLRSDASVRVSGTAAPA